MLFVTGDTHGDFSRFTMDGFPEQKNLCKEDYVIVCGDFGILDDSKRERQWLDWLNDRSFTTLFVAGNHSNYDLLRALPVREWNGGEVQFIRDSIIHLMRGQVYSIGGKRIFTMGGASSNNITDGILELNDPDFLQKWGHLAKEHKLYRINHLSWWKEELPNEEEYATALRNLDACGWDVDYIITHCGPSSIVEILRSGMNQCDRLTDFFEEIKERCRFEYWFFGHYHDDRSLMLKYILLYEHILEIDTVCKTLKRSAAGRK